MVITSVPTDPCRDGHSPYCEHQDQIKAAEEEFGVSLANPERVVASARDIQVGGDHYQKHSIQPWDIWEEYGLDAFTGAVIKYLLRNKGNRLEDLKKARHTLDKLIEIEEKGQNGKEARPVRRRRRSGSLVQVAGGPGPERADRPGGS